MDNFSIDVVCEGLDPLKTAMELAFTRNGKRHSMVATHYIIDEVLGLVFLDCRYSEPPSEASKLITPLLHDLAAELAWAWLQNAPYGREPDHDGNNHKGWRVVTNGWGHVGGHGYRPANQFNVEGQKPTVSYHRGICSIQPVWAMYGK